ncbi:hypothetical protein [Paenibacillus sp. GXUN7292]
MFRVCYKWYSYSEFIVKTVSNDELANLQEWQAEGRLLILEVGGIA